MRASFLHGLPRNQVSKKPGHVQGILEWINAAKTSTTRSKRIEQTASLAQQNRRANQWPRTLRPVVSLDW